MEDKMTSRWPRAGGEPSENPAHGCAQLDIFDFDGTLFRSPEPNPSIWGKGGIGRMMNPVLQGGLGWFQDLRTLLPPMVEEHPDTTWFHPTVLEAAHRSLRDPSHVAVILTGRTVPFEARIAGICASAGLTFHSVHCKTSPALSTMKFKQQAIRGLIDVHRPACVQMWEDRPHHKRQFLRFLGELRALGKISSFCVVDFDVEPRYADEEDEIRLVQNIRSERNMEATIATFAGLALDESLPEGATVGVLSQQTSGLT
eukprot:RCo008939